jgi:hypothetical protein
MPPTTAAARSATPRAGSLSAARADSASSWRPCAGNRRPPPRLSDLPLLRDAGGLEQDGLARDRHRRAANAARRDGRASSSPVPTSDRARPPPGAKGEARPDSEPRQALAPSGTGIPQCLQAPRSPVIPGNPRQNPPAEHLGSTCKSASSGAQASCIAPRRSGVRVPLAPCWMKPLRERGFRRLEPALPRAGTHSARPSGL